MEPEFTDSTFSEVYVAAPKKPDGFDLEVKAITGGLGRVVWGMDVFTFRKTPKYPWKKFGVDRWIYEVKIDQSGFNMAEWNMNRYQIVDGISRDVLGPRPPKWGMKMVLMEPHTCAYMPCDEQFLIWLRMNHQLAVSAPTGKFAALAAYQKMMADSAQEDAEREAEIDSRVDAIIDYAKTNEFEINNRRAYSVPSEEKRIIVCQV